MTITATIDEYDAVVLTYFRTNTTSNLGVPDAASLADDLASTLQPDQGDIVRDGYNVLVTAEGVTVEVYPNSFPIPWQHITSVVGQLRVKRLTSSLTRKRPPPETLFKLPESRMSVLSLATLSVT